MKLFFFKNIISVSRNGTHFQQLNIEKLHYFEVNKNKQK